MSFCPKKQSITFEKGASLGSVHTSCMFLGACPFLTFHTLCCRLSRLTTPQLIAMASNG